MTSSFARLPGFLRTPILLLAASLAACAPAVTGVEGHGGGGSGGSPGGGAGGGAGGSGGASATCAPSTASHQTVTINVRNDAADTRLLSRPMDSWSPSCAGFAVVDAVGKEVGLELGFECPCECAPPEVGITYRILGSGDTFTLAHWDARAYALCTETVDCSDWGGDPAPTHAGSTLQPVAPGTYTVTVAYRQTAAASCYPPDGWEITCPGSDSDWPQGNPFLSLCSGSATASATFDLPPSGDVVVTLTLQ